MTGVEFLAQALVTRPRGQARPAHGVCRHGCGDQGDQRHRARLLPAQAVGPSRGAAVSRARRPVERLAGGAPGRPGRSARRRSPLVGAEPRDQDLPRPQSRPLPLVRSRARRGGPAAARCRARGCGRSAAGARSRPGAVAGAVDARSRGCARPAHDRRAAAVRPVHRRRRARRARGRRLRRLGGLADRRHRARGARAGRPARAPRSRTTSASRRASPAPTSPTVRSRKRGASAPRWCSPAMSSASRRAGRCGPCASAAGPRSRRGPCSSPPACPTGCSTRPGLEGFTGRGVYYGATASEARQCEGDDVYVVGAANSAGQAALNLARFARRVVLLVRSDALEKSMSRYLVERISTTGNIEVRLRTEVVAGRGDDHLEEITHRRPRGRHQGGGADELALRLHRRVAAHRLARTRRRPRRARLRHHRRRSLVPEGRVRAGRWHVAPFVLETSVPGVFAAGDVRLDSMKRVASAVGEGAMSVYLVHRYLATI